MNNVNHPSHYNIEGRKECWDEMEERFGREELMIFCKLNSYKYRYRYAFKNGQEDLEKADEYKRKYIDLGGNVEDFDF